MMNFFRSSLNDLKNELIGEYNKCSCNELYKGFVQSEIKSKGLEIGRRWRIHEEMDALIFRDMITPGDNRYAMIKGRYRNL